VRLTSQKQLENVVNLLKFKNKNKESLYDILIPEDGYPVEAYLVIDKDGAILSYELPPLLANRNLLGAPQKAYTIYDFISAEEAICLLALINHTISHGRQTMHVHRARIRGQWNLRAAVISAIPGSSHAASVVSRPYPP
jgi:hypothetical protein